MLSIKKKKIGSYKNLWPKRHLVGFEKIFNNESVQTVNFSEKVLFINLRWRFYKRKEWDFSHKGWGGGGGGYKDTPGCLDTDSPILACSRLSDRGEGAKTYEQKKN